MLMSDAGGSRTNAYNLSAWLCRFVVGGRACCQPRQEGLVRIELVVAGTQQIPATLRRCFRWVGLLYLRQCC